MRIIEVIQRIQSGYSKGVQSDDSRLSNRHIYSALLTARSLLVTRQAKKREKISDWNYLILPCVELIEVPASECPCLPEVGCRVYRTKYPLPKPLTDMNDHLIDWVLTVEGSMIFDETTREEYRHNKGNKYTSNKKKYILESRHAFFMHPSNPKAVKIKILPENPQEAYDYPSLCPCKDCEDCQSILDKEFPLDGELIKPAIDIAIDELIRLFRSNQEDQTNNSADSIKEQSK